MAIRHWTCHWQNRFWRRDVNPEFEAVSHAAGNNFSKRGVSPGDVVYIISLAEGQLFLGGRMTIDRILNRPEAVELFGHENFYEADEHLIGVEGSGTPLNLHRRLSPSLSKSLRFASKSGPKELFFIAEDQLDNQSTRGVRELTAESAALLDKAIEITDRMPRSIGLMTVNEQMLVDHDITRPAEAFRFPEELLPGTSYREGAVERVEINRYERDPKARNACILAHGTTCCICGFSFGKTYGPEIDGYTHVHHLRQVAEFGGEREVDPVSELRPVCPNCHAVLHHGGQCRSIDAVKLMLAKQKQGS